MDDYKPMNAEDFLDWLYAMGDEGKFPAKGVTAKCLNEVLATHATSLSSEPRTKAQASSQESLSPAV